MDLKKKMAFNEKMGLKHRFPRHINMMAKGGMVKAPVKMAGGGVLGDIGGGIQGVAGDFTAQNGYGASLAPTSTYNYGNVINSAGQNALGANGETQNILSQQQGLTNQLQGVANGTGPNPALAALNQSTGQNVANQGALMAGQRGAGANVGLIAREAAQQGATTQQQAVGQAATLQSQQQLNALGAIGTQQQNMANTNINQQNANTSLLGTGASANNAQNNTGVSNYGMAQGINSQVSQNNTNAVNQSTSGLLGGIGSAIGGPIGSILGGLAKGGVVGYDGGGMIAAPTPAAEPDAPSIPSTVLDGKLAQKNKSSSGNAPNLPDMPNTDLTTPDLGSQFAGPGYGLGADTSLGGDAASSGAFDGALGAVALSRGGTVHPKYHPKFFHEYFSSGGVSGGKIQALVSAKEVYLGPKQVKEVIERGADPMKIGHHFPGKDKVSKDSKKNDVISTTLEQGGVVLPIHITTHKDASNRGRKFVANAVAKHMKRPMGMN